MADSAVFDWVCGELEQQSSLDRLEARGTIRLALKQAGLDARNVTPDQIKVVIERLLADELRARGVSHEARIVRNLANGTERFDVGDVRATADSPDEVFRRLGGES